MIGRTVSHYRVLERVGSGGQLGAAFVLSGSLRRAGHRLRITTQMIETESGHSVWARRFDRQIEDVFSIQDEIAQNIAQALQVMLTEQEKRIIAKVPTADVQAYDYYLRGRQFFHQAGMRWSSIQSWPKRTRRAGLRSRCAGATTRRSGNSRPPSA